MIAIAALELAMQLKERGFPQADNEFYWVQDYVDFEFYLEWHGNLENYKFKSVIAAPTAEEIKEDLQKEIPQQLIYDAVLKAYRHMGGSENNLGKMLLTIIDADLLAEMWLYLREDKLREEIKAIPAKYKNP